MVQLIVDADIPEIDIDIVRQHIDARFPGAQVRIIDSQPLADDHEGRNGAPAVVSGPEVESGVMVEAASTDAIEGKSGVKPVNKRAKARKQTRQK